MARTGTLGGTRLRIVTAAVAAMALATTPLWRASALAGTGTTGTGVAGAGTAGVVGTGTGAAGAADSAGPTTRPGVAPVVLTGAQLPGWSRSAATGTPAQPPNPLDSVRDAHHGTLVVPPDARTGVPVGDVGAYRWDDAHQGWQEVPVQVDERFPYFLANFRSDFGVYSQTDTELTYAWTDERWNRTAGECTAEHPTGTPHAMADPVPTLDDDDEVAFMASDAGDKAPAKTQGPPGTAAQPADAARQEVAVADPLDPTATRYVYLFLRPGTGSSFDATTGYVQYQRDANADEWIDRDTFADDDPEKLGVSNTGYGPNLTGSVCDGTGATTRTSGDRFPRDGVTVSTDAYRWRATGRWMVRGLQVTRAGQPPRTYGPDLVDRWKGRAFQQSPDSSVSLVGFEDEQVNWEANSSLLGERTGPVRAIRETWGADSGTNVTKTETFYRDAVTYRYHLRVHPIPPDGLYTSWDYNAGVATHYYTPMKPDGVAIDGVNDDIGQVDGVGDFPAFFDAPDPTHNVPATILTWEQVSGAGDSGSLVYVLENKGPTSATEPAVVPYYRDDKCFDDGTGDDPVARPWPGEATTDQRVKDGYAAAAGQPYDTLTCDQRQGAWGSHGVHFFATSDTDNAFANSPVPVNEVDAQQWQFVAPTSAPTNVGDRYSLEVRTPLVAVAAPQANTPQQATSLAYVGPRTAQVTDAVTFAVRLTASDGDGTGIAGEDVTLRFRDRSWRVTTDASGVAAATLDHVSAPVGDATVDATYAGSPSRAPSSTSAAFTVERDAPRITVTYAAKTVAVTLADADDSTGLGGRQVDVLVDGTLVRTLTTALDGRATTTGVHAGKGARVEARFAGDATYLAAAAATTVSR
jgi:hypothetical protein